MPYYDGILFSAFHANDVWVQLTGQEFSEAWSGGGAIRKSSLDQGFRENILSAGQSKANSLGALAERIVAKALDIPWRLKINNTAAHGPKEPDLPFNVEARCIGVEWYGLRVYPGDTPGLRIVGVVIPKGQESRCVYRIPGWIYARHAQARVTIDPNERSIPFHAIPQDQLHHLDVLRELIGWEKACLASAPYQNR